MIIGVAGGEYGVRGYLKSFDAKTGELEWQTYTIPAPGEPGNETWPKDDSWKTGGGPTWLTGSYDRRHQHALLGHRQSRAVELELHPGDNLWTDSMLALDPDTGKIKWGFKYTPNDAWDYDGMATPILVDTKIDGKPTQGWRSSSNRNGFFYVHRPHQRQVHLCHPARRGHQLDDRPRSEDRQADDQRGDEAEHRRRQGRDDRARARGRHQLVPAGLQSRSRPVLRRRQSMGHGADGLGEEEAHLQARRSLHGCRLPDVPHGRHHRPHQGVRRRQQEGRSGKCRARCRCSPACWRPRAACCSRATSAAVSWPSMPRPARCCGNSRPVPASTPRRSPTSSTASNMSRSCRASAAIRASTTRRRKAACSGSLPIDGKVDEGSLYNAQVIEKMLPSQAAVKASRQDRSRHWPRGADIAAAAPRGVCPGSFLGNHCRQREPTTLAQPGSRQARRDRSGPRHLSRKCLVCHQSAGARGPNIFATKLSDEQFLETVINGRKGTQMPAFGERLSPDEVWQVHAFVKSTDHY